MQDGCDWTQFCSIACSYLCAYSVFFSLTAPLLYVSQPHPLHQSTPLKTHACIKKRRKKKKEKKRPPDSFSCFLTHCLIALLLHMQVSPALISTMICLCQSCLSPAWPPDTFPGLTSLLPASFLDVLLC